MYSLPLFPFVRRGAWAGTGPYLFFLAEQGEQIAPIARLQAVAPVNLDAHDEVGGPGGAEDPLARKESQDQHGERAGDVEESRCAGPIARPATRIEPYGVPRQLGASSSNLALTPRDSTETLNIFSVQSAYCVSMGLMGVPLSPWP